MAELRTLREVADGLADASEKPSNSTFETVGELVDALVALGSTDKIHVHHDDYLGLKDDLTDSFLNLTLEEADEAQFDVQRECILEQANIVIPLSTRQVLEDEEEEIDEDRAYRGASDR